MLVIENGFLYYKEKEKTLSLIKIFGIKSFSIHVENYGNSMKWK